MYLCILTLKKTNNINEKRQSKGGEIMIWGMVTPNGMLIIKQLHGKIKSHDYLEILETLCEVNEIEYGAKIFFCSR